MTYTVTFIKYHTYEVEADNYFDAEKKAHDRFKNDMLSPVASAWYDDVDIYCDEGE